MTLLARGRGRGAGGRPRRRAARRAVYGVNTGFGKLAAPASRRTRSRSCSAAWCSRTCAGSGPPLPDPVVRLVLALKAASLALGYSGVRGRTIELLLTLLEHDALPVIPAKGSVGASGDLAPLAHLAGCLIGEGEVRLGGATHAGGRGAGAASASRAADARRQGGPGAAERHPGLDRACAHRLFRAAGGVRGRAGRRRA